MYYFALYNNLKIPRQGIVGLPRPMGSMGGIAKRCYIYYQYQAVQCEEQNKQPKGGENTKLGFFNIFLFLF